MTSQFDASYAFNGPVSEEVQEAHRQEIERSMSMPGKISNAKLHANNELQRWALSCNRLVWGPQVSLPLRPPSREELGWLMEQLNPEYRERLLTESRAAAEARHLVELLDAAEVEVHARLAAQRMEDARVQAEQQARLQAQQAREARTHAERALWEEFEAFDEAHKEERFHAWRTARGR
ncbi:MAG: hypothetical protein ACLPX9_21700 [Rhodomicrobium sp.]